ncbi:MAG: copper amine oxidase N-terminal domain-containing protein, partial [Defluviitaleaceae bacterium]|nr:copper amine oxidase N-terminal domain-containing protein [Defluviitaleaceae bacterium]
SIWTNVDNDPQLVEAPFRFVPNPVNANYTMGMLSPRVFAHWISGSTGFDDGVVTLTGMHFDGTPVEVVMTVGQNYAFINGQRHDIATFAARDGHGTGPTGSVTPMNVDGRVFVPIRFLTNAFGRFVTFDGDFPNVVVTLEG